MSWQRFLNAGEDDPEMQDLERRRSVLMKKERKKELRKEVERLERASAGERKSTGVHVDDKFWQKRGIAVVDARSRR
jgi:hypothetical protein